MLALSLVLATNYKQVQFVVPAPYGIYKPDFQSCSIADRDLYQATLPGYLFLTKDYFNVAIYGGDWVQAGNKITLTTSEFMGRNVEPDADKQSRKSSFIRGFNFVVQPNHDLILQPPTGMVMKSTLRFRRQKPIRLIEALKQSFEFILSNDNEIAGLKTNYANFSLLSNFAKPYQASLFEILQSTESFDVRAEAAKCLERVQSEKIVRYAGETLLKLPPAKTNRSRAIFRRRLMNLLESSAIPISFDYAKRALDKKFIGLTTAYNIAGESGHPGAVAFLKESLKTNGKFPEYVIQNLQKLSHRDAIEVAKQYTESQVHEVQFQALRTLAECEPEYKERNKWVQILGDRFESSDWMEQCDIAKTLGKAQTGLALEYLQKVNHKGSHPAVQQWIDMAIQKYKS